MSLTTTMVNVSISFRRIVARLKDKMMTKIDSRIKEIEADEIKLSLERGDKFFEIATNMAADIEALEREIKLVRERAEADRKQLAIVYEGKAKALAQEKTMLRTEFSNLLISK